MSYPIFLLVNLGSPDTPEAKDIRSYLRQFLMDPDVITLPLLLRKMLLEFCILPLRTHKVVEAYRSVWTEQGSPLLTNSRNLEKKIAQHLPYPTYLAMRYGSPSLESVLTTIAQEHQANVHIYLVPLYPHYADSTVKSSILETQRLISKNHPQWHLNIFPPFFNKEGYIQALVKTIKPYLTDCDHLLFSYHGIPESHIRKADPTKKHCLKGDLCCKTVSKAHATCYRYQTIETTRCCAKALQLTENQYSLSYQSRLGRTKWLSPYTENMLVQLAHNGIKKLAVVCPSFTADCLETLEEIGIRGKETFLQAGGEELHTIPCLNNHDLWIDFLTKELSNMAHDTAHS